MKNEYNLLLRTARWLRRFRKRCGYGVHSPFAFDFITDVIYNSDAFYAYEPLRRNLAASISRLDEYDPDSGLAAKDLRLIFRITNWAQPLAMRLYGASATTTDYIIAARPSLTAAASAPSAQGPTITYCDNASLIPDVPEPGTIIVRGIHNNPRSLSRWEDLKASKLCTVSFDLGRFGIVVTHPKLNKQHYIVNYF